MPNKPLARATPNKVLARLSVADFDLPKNNLKTIDLPLRFQVEDQGKAIKARYDKALVLRSVICATNRGHFRNTCINKRKGVPPTRPYSRSICSSATQSAAKQGA